MWRFSATKRSSEIQNNFQPIRTENIYNKTKKTTLDGPRILTAKIDRSLTTHCSEIQNVLTKNWGEHQKIVASSNIFREKKITII